MVELQHVMVPFIVPLTARYGAVVLYLVYHVTLPLYCTCYSTLRCRSIAPFTARYGAAARFCAV